MSANALYELAEKAGRALERRNLTLATAESCTGGWIAEAVTAIPGSSAWFDRGFVTYSNASKREVLGVTPESLDRHGAVSEAVVIEMAHGALRASQASVSIAVSGVAGPSGGTPQKPVGTVCFAWAASAGSSRAETRRFDGDREMVRRQSVVHALGVLLDMIDEATT